MKRKGTLRWDEANQRHLVHALDEVRATLAGNRVAAERPSGAVPAARRGRRPEAAREIK